MSVKTDDKERQGQLSPDERVMLVTSAEWGMTDKERALVRTIEKSRRYKKRRRKALGAKK